MIVCNGLTAAAVHARDIEKSEYAKNFGYQVLVIWEIDRHADKELSLQKMIEFLG
jgi:G:T-mismatch repair DNA endonuclease (very short patch repair protein)